MPPPPLSIQAVRRDCRWFRGDVPCAPHKLHGVHCTDPGGAPCAHYRQTSGDILVIKLGAIGDVIRTTPLLRRLRATRPDARLWWLTLTPEVVPREVDVVLPFTPQSVATLLATRFSALYNLDKDREACALASLLHADLRKGFVLVDGRPAPADDDAAHKFLTGLFDDLSRADTSSYVREMFEICGFEFRDETYILDPCRDDGYVWTIPRRRPIVGLNTGCGGRWVSRLWPEKNWAALARRLRRARYTPLLLGGEQEHLKNRRIARASGALYPGHFPLRQFINLVDQCDLVVTAVTMAMHITIGLGKKIVLFNNVFNRNEFELYGLGEIIEPDFDCPCYYTAVCPNNCMQYITVDTVEAAVRRLLPPAARP